ASTRRLRKRTAPPNWASSRRASSSASSAAASPAGSARIVTDAGPSCTNCAAPKLRHSFRSWFRSRGETRWPPASRGRPAGRDGGIADAARARSVAHDDGSLVADPVAHERHGGVHQAGPHEVALDAGRDGDAVVVDHLEDPVLRQLVIRAGAALEDEPDLLVLPVLV